MGRRLDWSRARRWQASDRAFPDDGTWATATAASPVRHLVRDGKPVTARHWSPWVEVGADDRVPMTGEVFTAIAMGGRMWSRQR